MGEEMEEWNERPTWKRLGFGESVWSPKRIPDVAVYRDQPGHKRYEVYFIRHNELGKKVARSSGCEFDRIPELLEYLRGHWKLNRHIFEPGRYPPPPPAPASPPTPEPAPLPIIRGQGAEEAHRRRQEGLHAKILRIIGGEAVLLALLEERGLGAEDAAAVLDWAHKIRAGRPCPWREAVMRGAKIHARDLREAG